MVSVLGPSVGLSSVHQEENLTLKSPNVEENKVLKLSTELSISFAFLNNI